MTDLEDLIDGFLGMMRVIVPAYPDGEAGLFPNGSCIGVSAFLIPFVRLSQPATVTCDLVIGKFEGKSHAWIECNHAPPENRLLDFYVDPTVWQFNKYAPRVVKIVDGLFYEAEVWLNHDEEEALRTHAEIGFQSLSTRDGKRWFSHGMR